MTDSRGHPANLSVTSFADGQAQPSGWHVLAKPDRHRSVREHGRLGEQLDFRRQRPTVLELDAAPEPFKGTEFRHPLHLNEIGLGVFESRVGQTMGEPAVIGQEQKPFAVAVEPSDGIDFWDRHERLERFPPRDVAKLAEDVVGLEELQVMKRFLTQKEVQVFTGRSVASIMPDNTRLAPRAGRASCSVRRGRFTSLRHISQVAADRSRRPPKNTSAVANPAARKVLISST